MVSKRLTVLAVALLPALHAFAQKKTATTAKPSEQPVILTLGPVRVPSAEFAYVYNKNNANAEDAHTEKSVREYLELYTNFKLKVMEAERRKMDTASGYQKELDTYRKQLAQPYLNDKQVTEALMREAYERMKTDVDASHILILCALDAAPKDTLAAFKKVNDLRARALKGEDFGALAKANSEDPSAKQNNGRLGYFSALQMVYPFESAAFNTKVGTISTPVRTSYGYHIIKVHDRRPNPGRVKVAHLMVRLTPEMSRADSNEARNKINEIYKRASGGEKWNDLTSQFSDDAGTKENGGELPEFSSGQMLPAFEEPSFKLSKPGDLSQPFLTPYGWHIVRLIERKPVPPYDEIKADIQSKVSKDSRAQKNRSAVLARLKKENNLVEDEKVKKAAFAKADTSMLSGNWRYKKDDKLNDRTLFTIGSQAYKVRDFFVFVENTQQPHPSSEAKYLISEAYKAYLERELFAHEEQHLSEKYEDYRMLMKEYRDGILLFQLMDEKVWTKALEDTTGLRNYYEQNKGNYRWDRRVKATVYNVANQAALDRVRQMAKSKSFAMTEPKFTDLTFDKNASKINEEGFRTVTLVASIMRADNGLVLDINGGAAKGEKAGMAMARAKAVADSLVKRGIDRSRLNVKDVSKNKTPLAESKVNLVLFGNSPRHMERELNSKTPLTLQVNEGLFSKGDNQFVDKVEWKQGEQVINHNDRIILVQVHGVEEPRMKTLNEARGQVISDYQNYLEKQWVKELRAQNPPQVNEVEVKKLVKKQ